MRLYLDLDGVMADFDAHFLSVFGSGHRGMADDAMWERINAHPSYFLDMPLCHGAQEFFASIRHLDPIILTACPRTNYAHVATQKRAWVRKHLSATATVLPVMGGRNKALFMDAPGDILIDDFARNLKPWSDAGGVSILHTNFAETAHALRAAIAARLGEAPLTAGPAPEAGDLISRADAIAAVRAQFKGSDVILGGQRYGVVQLAEAITALRALPAPVSGEVQE